MMLLTNQDRALSDREHEILMRIVRLYILKARPVGSRALAKYLENEIKLSSATIRNVMADLEELEYISHPHTSAGRVPTDKGYRFYVDSLNDFINLDEKELSTVRDNLQSSDTNIVLRDASKILGMLSKYLGIVKIPNVVECKILKLEIISLSSKRLLVVLALDSNLVRAVTLEAEFDIEQKHLQPISQFINEKISGRSLKFIKENFKDILSDLPDSNATLVRFFIESLDAIFQEPREDRLLLAGTQNLLELPEFEDREKVRSVVELIENQDLVIHLLDRYEVPRDIKVLIGSEMNDNILGDYSLVLGSYTIGSGKGTIGLIGPKRMNYPKMISIVKAVSNILSGSD